VLHLWYHSGQPLESVDLDIHLAFSMLQE